MVAFDKNRFISNIYSMAERKGVRISALEEAAHTSTGYFSKLNKVNGPMPSIELAYLVADRLGTDISILVDADLSAFNNQQLTVINFIDKLLIKTKSLDIQWKVERQHDLNNLDNENAKMKNHPLFSLETFYRNSETEYPDLVTETVFRSKSYDCNTYINGDCYHYILDGNVTLYLMSISKDVHKSNDLLAENIEIWLYSPDKTAQFLCSSHSDLIGSNVQELYETICELQKNPPIDKTYLHAIESFINDDK